LLETIRALLSRKFGPVASPRPLQIIAMIGEQGKSWIGHH